MSPVLAYFIVDSTEEGIDRAEEMVMFHGMGHSAVIHAMMKISIQKYAATMKAKRLIVNFRHHTVQSVTFIIQICRHKFTLGCGSYGGNSVSGNVITVNLINQKESGCRGE